MRRHERFAWTWAVAGVVCGVGLVGMGKPAGARREAPEGTGPVSFSTRGAPRDEEVTFLEGMGPSTGGFGLKLEEVPLTRGPKQYTIGPGRDEDGKVVASPRPNGA